MSVVKLSWSGGKDSTCAFYKRLENGDSVKALCYIPFFTEDIPLIGKAHYDFIFRQACKFRNLGASVSFVYGLTFWDYCFSVLKKGAHSGEVRGYPFVNFCGFKRESKIASLSKADVGFYDFVDIGIAYDEFKRHSQLTDFKRSILFDEKITESMAERFCIENGCLSPHYLYEYRDGCALCANASSIRRENWYLDYPFAKAKVLELQEKLKPLLVGRKNEFPLRGYRYFI